MNRKPLAHGAAALLVLAGGLTAALLLGIGGGHLRGEQADDPKPVRNEIISVASCAGCHGGPVESAGAYRRYNTADENGQKVTDFIRCDEYEKWNNTDPHQYAYKNIAETETGKSMSRILGYDVTKKAECLVCHAVEATPVTTALDKKSFLSTDGVGCTGCHGVADERWLAAHQLKSWREKAPKEKASFGQYDLRDPVARAARCAACHVGNKAEGKFVTHEMYAAGHPPLPPLEVARFGKFQTVHWYPPDENKYFNVTLKDRPDDVYRLFHYRPGDPKDMTQARVVVLGALTTFREAMATLAEEARGCAESEKDPEKATALDLANFDCWACHHDLKRPSWRQERGYPGIAGRPVMRQVPLALVQIAQDLYVPSADKGALDKQLATLRKSFDARPFGQPTQVASAAAGAVKWADQQIAAVRDNTKEFTPKESQRLLVAIADALRARPAGPKEGPSSFDYDQARQMIWAFEAVRAELNGGYDKVPADNPITKKIKGLDDQFAITLRDPSKPPVPLSGDLLRARLTHLNDFDPRPVQQVFGEIYSAMTKGAKPAGAGN